MRLIFLIIIILYIHTFGKNQKLMAKIQYSKTDINIYIRIINYYVKVIALLIIQILSMIESIVYVLIKMYLILIEQKKK